MDTQRHRLGLQHVWYGPLTGRVGEDEDKDEHHQGPLESTALWSIHVPLGQSETAGHQELASGDRDGGQKKRGLRARGADEHDGATRDGQLDGHQN